MHRNLLALTLLSCCCHGGARAADDQPVEPDPGGPPTQAAPSPTLWIIGDSTVRVGTPGQRGWGDELAPFFDPEKLRIENRAIGGRSSRTFMTDGRWDSILKDLRPGDVVIIQFGHNDAGPINEDPPVTAATRCRGTIRNNSDETVDIVNTLTGQPETVHSYGWYLRQFATSAQQQGAKAVICSPIPHKSWSDEGTVNRNTESWGLWARQAAEQVDAQFLDLNEIIAQGYEQLGRAAVEPFFADRGTHTTVAGAQFNARAVVAGLNGLAPNPVDFGLSEAGRAVPAFVAPRADSQGQD